MRIEDQFGRPMGALRISVTDRCNLRCRYCMPAASYQWLPKESLLEFDEIARLAGLFAGRGVTKFRLTGGEPLLRPGLERLVGMLTGIEGVSDLALTTNGSRLAEMADLLKAAGLHRITLSLDTLRPERMLKLTRHDRSIDIHRGVAAAIAAGFRSVKMNTVVMRNFNDDELVDITDFATARGIEPRFIEYMDVGGALDWNPDAVVPRDEILEILGRKFGPAQPCGLESDPSAPAQRWRFSDGTVVGIVASTTVPFCSECDRSRLTADGVWYRCLYSESGTDLATPLRSGESDAQLGMRIEDTWRNRSDRGAEVRAALPDRGALVPLTRLREDPRLEMHVRGG